MIAAKIIPIGNSLGVRLPKPFLESIGADERDSAVGIELIDNAIVIRKQESASDYKSFEKLMEDFYQKPFDQIDVYMESPEIDWGGKMGDEIW